MKKLLVKALRSNHALEVLFSSLRWFFLLMSAIVFSTQMNDNTETYLIVLFVALVTFGVIYMGLSDYCLYRKPENSSIYKIMTKGGPFFDYIAFLCLVALTGGHESPLFPISYLIILHVCVYWRYKGAMICAGLLIIGFTVVVLLHGFPTELSSQISFYTKLIYLFLIGFLGGIIVSRERIHYEEKSEYESMAKQDYLTGLFNHRSFQEDLKTAQMNRKNSFLVLADIDHFKKVNDAFGHVMGDKVLRTIGHIISDIVPEDIGKGYRYGGEEFAILLYIDDIELTDFYLRAIKKKIEKTIFHTDEGEFSVTMSFGCNQIKTEGSRDIVECVDKLLYDAKQLGRNRIVYEPTICIEEATH
ncbi:GGDEF domain-containing protein [Alkalihalobacterium bogoriense]|uniref:GGDEF domain-containing protein n=1 Tax=Alkalihalobacterium bogoriense TaxID=246272 RepID=UPI00068682D5|nr:GGDEF domain-containing protein [Alkalihalobacterium bogoriense]